jgi:cobalt-precorrin 5A hydrolase
MTTAVIFLERFREPAEKVASLLDAELIPYSPEAFGLAFPAFQRIVAVMATGIAVRATPLSGISGRPAVVVVAPDLLCHPCHRGHHGANGGRTSRALNNRLSPRHRKGGCGLRRRIAVRMVKLVNKEASRMINTALLDGRPVCAVTGPSWLSVATMWHPSRLPGSTVSGSAAGKAPRRMRWRAAGRLGWPIRPSQVLVYATTVKKSHEAGILEAVRALDGALIYLDDSAIGAVVSPSPSGASRIGLEGVAEPCALAVSRHKELVLKKTVFGGVTVAIAR